MEDKSGPVDDTSAAMNGNAGCSMDGSSTVVGVGPPSPLTGCYLMIVIGEPYSDEHKDIILQRLLKGFLSWNASDCQVDLEEELNTITLHAPEGEEARHGERLIQYASENLVTEILIHPQYNTLIQCMRNLLSSFTRHRHIIHAGYTFSGNGSWILQDGTFSVSDFSEAFQENDVQRVLRAYPDTITMDIHCESAGLWSVLPDKNFAKSCRIRINPVDVLDSGSDKINAFIDYLAPMVIPASLNELLESSDVVGNIRFSHPTLYVFPGGQGDAALFGINGFNMLVDGGFARKACFWDFTRHLDRLDAVLMTRISNCNINGLGAVVERKRGAHVYPQIGHFFCNIPERKGSLSPDGDKDKNPLLVDLYEKGHHLVNNLRAQNLQPQTCYRDGEPINLYHKVGHGTLDMYVLSPSKDAKEVKEFLQKWNSNDPKLFTPKDTKEFVFPIQNLVSICALLVWLPANPEDPITRILFPGSTPDYKIMEGLEKIKHLEFMKHPICNAKTLTQSISTTALAKKSIKSAISEKSGPDLILQSKHAIKQPEKDNKIMDNKLKSAIDNKKISDVQSDSSVEEKHNIIKRPETAKPIKADPQKIDNKITENEELEIIPTKDDVEKKDELDNKDENEMKQELDKKEEEKTEEKDEEKIETESKVIKKDEPEVKQTPKPKIEAKGKPKTENKAPIRSRIDTKPPRSMDKRGPVKKDGADKKDTSKASPTTTPKKTAPVTAPRDKEIKSKVMSRVSRSSPSSTPAKSAKDANNRKVLESKQKIAPSKKDISKPTAEKKEVKTERKPISRRPKTESPSRRAVRSPVKVARPARTKAEKDKKKLEKDGTTDSSVVSTPSADDATALKKVIGDVDTAPVVDVVVDDSKEEQECVREIEAVFTRDDEKAAKKVVLPGHREIVEISKQDSTTEAEEEEEYLIIEKEEVEQYTEDSINEQESITKEEEIQKHQRDSEESEKKRKKSVEDTEDEEKKDVAESEKPTEVADGDAKDETDEKNEEENAADDIQPDSIEDDKIPMNEQIKEEVQEIITSAKEIAKTRTESRDELQIKTEKTEEMSSPSPEDKISSAKKTSDTKDDAPEEAGGDAKDVGQPEQNLQESHPDEKFSATAESGATTAPTLPEDERIPLDEIKEDLIVEEKYVKEETKENEIQVSVIPPKVFEPLERVIPNQIKFDAQQSHLRDIVKTPDEVADLPVHEEADYVGYDDFHGKKDVDRRKSTESKEDEKKMDKKVEVKEEKIEKVVKEDVSKIAKEILDDKKEDDKTKEIFEKIEATVVDRVQKVGDKKVDKRGELPQTEDDILKHIESQIIIDTPTDLKLGDEILAKKIEVRRVESPVVPSEELANRVAEHDFIVPTRYTPPEQEDEKEIIVSNHVPILPIDSVKDEVPSQIDITKLDDIKDKLEQIKITEDKLNEVKHDFEKKIDAAKDKIEDLADKIETEIKDADKKLDNTIQEKKEVIDGKIDDATKQLKDEFVAVVDQIDEKKHEIKRAVDEKIHDIDTKLSDEVKKIDDKMTRGVETLEKKSVALKKDITEVDTMINETTKEVVNQFEETKEQVHTEITKKVEEVHEIKEEVEEKTKSGISSFFGGISQGIKSGIDKIADKIDEKLKDTTEAVDSKISDISAKTDKILKGSDEKPKSPLPEKSFDGYEYPKKISPPYDMKSFPTELRETHITTLDSPIKEIDRIGEIKTLEKLPEQTEEESEESPKSTMSFQIEDIKYATFEREDSNLNDIKEEEEEDRMSPPTENLEKKKSLLTDEKLEPPRSVSPRERTPEDVILIVTNVAEVLKSDKDLEEIIPDFDPEELEKKLSARASPVRIPDETHENGDDDQGVSTVQRMLVTASSEDGGGEIEICPPGSIKFDASGATTPDLRSGRLSPELDAEKLDDSKLNDEVTSIMENGTVDEKHTEEIKREVEEIIEKSKASIVSSHEIKKEVTEKIEEVIKTEIKQEVHEEHIHKLEEIKSTAVTEAIKEIADVSKETKDLIEKGMEELPKLDLTIKQEKDIEMEPESLDKHDLSFESSTSIKSIPDDSKDKSPQSSGKSTPDLKEASPPISIDEKEKHELPEKAQKDLEKPIPKITSTPPETQQPTIAGAVDDRKESVVSDVIVDSRRESAISSLSEKDYTKEESSLIIDDRELPSHASDKSIEDIKDEIERASAVKRASLEKDEVDILDAAINGKQKIDEVDGKLETTPKEPTTSIIEIVAMDIGDTLDKEKGVHEIEGKDEMDKLSHKLEEEDYGIDEVDKSAVNAAETSESPGKADDLLLAKDDKPDANKTPNLAKEEISPKQSRPESAASHKSEDKETTKDDKQEKDSKSVEASRPESAASHISDTKHDDQKHKDTLKQSRPESSASHTSDMIHEHETKIQTRPESVASHIDDEKHDDEKVKESPIEPEISKDSRPVSAASHVSDTKLDTEKDLSRPISAASHTSDAKHYAELGKDSRRESAASHVSGESKHDAETAKEESRRESAASHVSGDANHDIESAKDSRRESGTSHVSVDVKREEHITKESRSASVASHVSDEKHDEEKIKESRPVSAASHLSDVKVDADKPKESRPESAASHISDSKVEPEVLTDLKSKDASPEESKHSRPESAVSHVSDIKPDSEKDKESRPLSVASHTSDTKPDAEVMKGSRPESAASHISETKLEVDKDHSRPLSAASHTSDTHDVHVDDTKLDFEKVFSRPESVASYNSDIKKETEMFLHKESRSSSVASHVSETKVDIEKSHSRSESAASHSSETKKEEIIENNVEQVKLASSESKIETTSVESTTIESKTHSMSEIRHEAEKTVQSVLETIATQAVDTVALLFSDHTEPIVDSAKDSRPESAASHLSGEKLKDSRPESAASQVNDSKRESVHDLLSQSIIGIDVKEEIIEKSVASRSELEHKGEKTPSPKESRPESVASHTSDHKQVEVSRPESVTSHTSDHKQVEVSRPESVTSHTSDQKQVEVSRPESVTSHTSDHKQVEVSRPESVASHTSDHKQVEVIRPESVASHTSDHKRVEVSRPESVTSHTSDQKQVEVSRPESVTSHTSDHKQVEVSRPESAASQTSDQKQVEVSRPESVASHTSDHKPVEVSRPDSVASHTSDHKHIELSRPESVASHISDHKPDENEEPEFLDIHISTCAYSRAGFIRGSTADLIDDEDFNDIHISTCAYSRAGFIRGSADGGVEEDEHRSASVASHVSDAKSDEDKHKHSRPESVASHVSDAKSELDKHDVPTPEESKVDSVKNSRPPSAASHTSDHIIDHEILKQSRPESAASHASESKFDDVKLKDSRRESVASHASHLSDAKSEPEKCDEPKEISEDSMLAHISDCAYSRAGFIRGVSPDVRDAEGEEHEHDDVKLSRPESASSHISDTRVDDHHELKEHIDETKKTVDEKSESVQVTTTTTTESETFVEKSTSHETSKESLVQHSTSSRPESVASHTSEKHVDNSKSQEHSRPESRTSIASDKHDAETSRPASVLSERDEEILTSTKSVVKESRSKSVASIMTSSMYRDHDDSHPLSALDEIQEYSKDDSDMTKYLGGSKTSLFDELEKRGSLKSPTPSQATPSPKSESKEDSKSFEKSSTIEKDSLEPSSASMKTTIEKDSLSMDTPKSILDDIWGGSQAVEDKHKPVDQSPDKTDSQQDTVSSQTSIIQVEEIKSSETHVDTTSKSESITTTMSETKTEIQSNNIATTSKTSTTTTAPLQVNINLSGKSSPDIEELDDSPQKYILTDLTPGHKTPPTVPVSPNIIGEFIMTQSGLDTETTSPKDQSGKSSPRLVHTSSESASKSTSVGQISGGDTSDSSPKPTSPFPKGIQAIKVEETKTTSGMSTPDMTRMSTPDIMDSKYGDKSDPTSDSTTTVTTVAASSTMTDVKKSEEIKQDKSEIIETSKTEVKESQQTTKTTTFTAVPLTSKDVANLKSAEYRSYTPGSDDYDIHEISSPRSDISSGQASRVVTDWTQGSSEERHYSDDEVPSSPMSVTSQAAHSPPTKYGFEDPYDLQRSGSGVSKKSDIEIDDSQDDIPPQYGSEELKSAISISSTYRPDPMSTSFYGALPEMMQTKSDPIPIGGTSKPTGIKSHLEYQSSGPDSHHTESFTTKIMSTDHKFLDEADLDFEKALEEHRQVRGADVMSSITSKYEYSPTKQTDTSQTYTNGKEFLLEDIQKSGKPNDIPTTSATNVKPTTTQQTQQPQLSKEKEDLIASWGKPLGLPAPAPVPIENDMRNTTPKRERRIVNSKTKINNEKNLRKRSESPIKGKKPGPVYMDLTYVPHHGNSYYSHVEFFKRVRARYYVFSGTEPSREVYNALLEAKQTWEDKDLEVTIIPTYDTDVLGYWVSENEDLLAKYHIDLSPSASRCTINLQDHETSCSAYRLEF